MKHKRLIIDPPIINSSRGTCINGQLPVTSILSSIINHHSNHYFKRHWSITHHFSHSSTIQPMFHWHRANRATRERSGGPAPPRKRSSVAFSSAIRAPGSWANHSCEWLDVVMSCWWHGLGHWMALKQQRIINDSDDWWLSSPSHSWLISDWMITNH